MKANGAEHTSRANDVGRRHRQENEGMWMASQAAKLCQAAVWPMGWRICCTTT